MESGGLLGGGRGAPRAQPQAPGASASNSGSSRSSSRRAGGGGGGGGGGPGCPELHGEAMPRRGLRAPAHSARMAWPGPPPRTRLSPRRPRNGAGWAPTPSSGSGSCSAPNGRGGGSSSSCGGARDGSITPGKGWEREECGRRGTSEQTRRGGRCLRAPLSARPPRTGPPPPAPVCALNRYPCRSCTAAAPGARPGEGGRQETREAKARLLRGSSGRLQGRGRAVRARGGGGAAAAVKRAVLPAHAHRCPRPSAGLVLLSADYWGT